ncbi:MAG TPA: PilZ domain-containing protein [Pyrinomonadaceae bacterium]|nr:PilZ domain-containing protein [Pyrinomonadaceae bacterium]
MKNGSRPGAPDSRRPRSPRVPVNFSLVIEGETAGGKPFKTKASAIKVSRTGATIVIDEDVALGARILLTPPFGGRFEADVNGVWIDENDGRRHIGVKLVNATGWFTKQG